MPSYVIPAEGQFDELVETAKKAGVDFLAPATVRDYILETSKVQFSVSALKGQDLLVLNKHGNTLLDEMPTVVMSVPGVVYTGDWVALATAFHSIDWSELEAQLSKSGHLATSPDDLVKRDTGVARESFADMVDSRDSMRPKLGTAPREHSYNDPSEDNPDMDVE